MQVSLLYFASVREHAGVSVDHLDLPAGAVLSDALTAARSLHPTLELPAPGIRYARNGEFAALDAPLSDGDELAVIPPVSGG